jgi:hypothetical protein
MIGLMNNKFEKLRKEPAVAWFKLLYRNFPGDTEEIHENIGVVSRSFWMEIELEYEEVNCIYLAEDKV